MQAFARDAVVAEVAEDIGEVRDAVVFGTEAQVAVLVEPACHGSTAGHQHPLPDVKLPAARQSLLNVYAMLYGGGTSYPYTLRY